ncbi:predicted protein [Arabidopsis lyrata subsp. lyrata]|uniref:Predicted protein n=1 Tax=Arabidopsis lyrata subsp. lyrata TaxID=81972 RepID=D7LPR2_ARALL|nr:predicted protein [Arabidopsis lyrata subsp. lyrata]
MDSNDLDTNALIVHEEATGVGPQEEGDPGDNGPDNVPDDEDPRERDAFEIEKIAFEGVGTVTHGSQVEPSQGVVMSQG